jgi:hypothetical protein
MSFMIAQAEKRLDHGICTGQEQVVNNLTPSSINFTFQPLAPHRGFYFALAGPKVFSASQTCPFRGLLDFGRICQFFPKDTPDEI